MTCGIWSMRMLLKLYAPEIVGILLWVKSSDNPEYSSCFNLKGWSTYSALVHWEIEIETVLHQRWITVGLGRWFGPCLSSHSFFQHLSWTASRVKCGWLTLFDCKGWRCRRRDTFACCVQKKVYSQSQAETLQHTERMGRHSLVRFEICACACLSTWTYPKWWPKFSLDPWGCHPFK